MPINKLPKLNFDKEEVVKQKPEIETGLPSLSFEDEKEEVPGWKSAVTGAAKGIPFVGEWTDEMAAAAMALQDIAKTERYSMKDLGELYDFYKGRVTEEDKKRLEANPKTAAVAQLATTLISPVPGGGIVGRAVGSAAEAATSQLGRELDVEKALKAGATGAGFSAAGELLRIPAFLGKKVAKKQAVKAVGLTPAKLQKIESRYGKKITEQIGDTIREKKLLPGMSPDKALRKTEKLLDKTGKEIGETLQGLHREQVPVDVADALNDIEHVLLAKFDDPKLIADKTIKASYNKFNEEILPELYNAAKTGSWQDFANMRQYLLDRLKTKTDNLPISKTEYRDAIVALDDVITNRLGQQSQSLADNYRKLKTSYGSLKAIEAGLKANKGDSVMGLVRRGKLLEAAGKAAVSPIVGGAQRQAIYRAPESAEALAEILSRRISRPLTKQDKD